MYKISLYKNDKQNDMIKAALVRGDDPNAGESGWTPLMNVVEAKNTVGMKLLIEYGATINMVSADTTPLVIACMGRNVAVVKMLLANGADINFDLPKLHVAFANLCQGGYTSVVNVIIDAGMDVKFLAEIRRKPPLSFVTVQTTPLIAAIRQKGSCVMVKTLLKAGADPSQVAQHWSPLSTAVECCRLDILRLLVSHGADVAADCQGGVSKCMRQVLELVLVVKPEYVPLAAEMAVAVVEAGAPLELQLLKLIGLRMSSGYYPVFAPPVFKAVIWVRRKHFLLFLNGLGYIARRDGLILPAAGAGCCSSSSATTVVTASSRNRSYLQGMVFANLHRYIMEYL